MLDTANQVESEYRVSIGDQIKYILVDPGMLHVDIISLPKAHSIAHQKMAGRVFRKSGHLAVTESS